MGEQNLSMLRKADPRDGTRRGVIFLHGAGGLETQAIDAGSYPNLTGIIRAIADAGYPVLSARQTGDGWANDATITKIGLAKTYLQGTLGAKSGKVFLFGGSMGAASAMAYARANPTSIAGLLLMLPVSDLQDFVTNDRGGLASSVNAAYSGGYSNATYGATHNPTTFASSLAGIPVQAWYSTTDTVVIASTVTPVMAAIGGVDLRALTGSHSDTPFGQVTIPDVLTFLAAAA